MRWIDFQPIAEFPDRHNIVRPIYGTTIMGRFEFAQRMTDIEQMLGEASETLTWESLYLSQSRFRHAINKALSCWGIDPEWLTPQYIEQLLFCRGEEPGWLIELSKGKESSDGKAAGTLAETIAIISSHCQSLTEALELANTVPSDLLVEITRARAANQVDVEQGRNPQQQEKERHLKENYNKIMAGFEQ